eukprot:1823058-Amphidinium_carterae.1
MVKRSQSRGTPLVDLHSSGRLSHASVGTNSKLLQVFSVLAVAMDDAASVAVNKPAVLEDALAEMNAKTAAKLRRQPNKILPLLQVFCTQDVSTKKRKAQCDTKLAFNSTYCKFEKFLWISRRKLLLLVRMAR